MSVPDGADFMCPECQRELMAAPRPGGFMGRLPTPVKVLTVAVPVLALVGFGVVKIIAFVGSKERGGAVDVPPVELVTDEFVRRLPAGYVLAGDPVLQRNEDGSEELLFRAPLRSEHEGLDVPIIDLQLPPTMPEVLDQMAGYLIVDAGLPPGKTLDVEAARPSSGPGREVEGVWRIRFELADGSWRVVEENAVEVTRSAVSSAAGGDVVFMTRAELTAFRSAAEAALSEYVARLEAVERDVENFRSDAFRGVPGRCTKDTAPLLAEVVRLTSQCPQISDASERDACFVRRDRLNSEIGECETQNRLHQEGAARANRATGDYERTRLDSFRQELVRQAEMRRSATSKPAPDVPVSISSSNEILRHQGGVL